MIAAQSPITIDTNIVIYAMSTDARTAVAASILANAAFLSVQVLNEYANVAVRKLKMRWAEVQSDIAALVAVVPVILPLTQEVNRDALRLAERYSLGVYDALLVANALAGWARTLYSEDMHHGLVVDERLTILNPFLALPEPL